MDAGVTMTKEPNIGDKFRVSIVARQRDTEFVVESPGVEPDWSVVLKSRAKSSVGIGETVAAWVIGTDLRNKVVFVSDSDFGRKDISDRMRPRYILALRAILRVLDGQSAPSHGDAGLVSEVKGMFTRCTKKDQWDWYSVYEALDRPAPEMSRRASELLGALARCLRDPKEVDVQNAIRLIREQDLTPALRNAIRVIEQGTPSLPDARRIAPRQVKASTSAVQEQDRRVLSSYEKEKLDKANATHEALLNRLAEFLEGHGHRVEENRFVDAFCRLKSGPAIFEAKSITDANELTQTRHALSQLYEYRYRHKLEDASLWVVFSAAPKQDWIVDYLVNDRDIRVIWLDGTAFVGPSVAQLTESGIVALMRQEGSARAESQPTDAEGQED